MTDVKDSSSYAAATTPGDMSNFYDEVSIAGFPSALLASMQ